MLFLLILASGICKSAFETRKARLTLGRMLDNYGQRGYYWQTAGSAVEMNRTHIILGYDYVEQRQLIDWPDTELVSTKALVNQCRVKRHRARHTSSQYFPVSTTRSPPADLVNSPCPSRKSFAYRALYPIPDRHALYDQLVYHEKAEWDSRFPALVH